jgi:uncharacterized protein YigE (DUF2233 family)
MSDFKPILLLLVFMLLRLFSHGQCGASNDSLLIYCVDLKKQNISFFWRDEENQPFRNFSALRSWLIKKNLKLVFAMNGGMYKTDNSPLGLYIESGKTVIATNKKTGSGNFSWKPNGIFYINNENIPAVTTTEKFKLSSDVKYATQSGPMLVIDGKMHPEFKKGSTNENIRNGVGIMANGQVLFAMSKMPINFYDFANFFLRSGCKNALYLDGCVSSTYLPSQSWKEQWDGDFGVIIAEVSTSK